MFGPIDKQNTMMTFYFINLRRVLNFQTIDAAYNALCFPEHASKFSGSVQPSFREQRKRNKTFRTPSIEEKTNAMQIALKNWIVYQMARPEGRQFLTEENLHNMSHPDFPKFGQMAVDLAKQVSRDLFLTFPHETLINKWLEKETSQWSSLQTLGRDLNYVEAAHVRQQKNAIHSLLQN